MRNLKFLAAGLLLPLLANASSTSLVSNGSFEQSVISSGSWSVLADLPGWSSGAHGIELRNSIVGDAQDGANFVELDTYHNSEIHQNLQGDADVQGWVNLTFWYSARPHTEADTNGLTFGFGSDLVDLRGEYNYSGDHLWKKWSGNFFLTTTDTLSFFASGLDDSYGTSLDNISVTRLTAAPVPEPASMALMGMGLFAVGGLVRRQRLVKPSVA